jgi:hypothetical protein
MLGVRMQKIFLFLGAEEREYTLSISAPLDVLY